MKCLIALIVLAIIGSSMASDVHPDCKLPITIGVCKAYFPKWGYKDNACVQFVYGGCQGNANRFDTKEACEAKCGKK